MAFGSVGGSGSGGFHTGSPNPGMAWNRESYDPEPGGPAEQAEYAAKTLREVEEDEHRPRRWFDRLLDAILRRR